MTMAMTDGDDYGDDDDDDRDGDDDDDECDDNDYGDGDDMIVTTVMMTRLFDDFCRLSMMMF